MTAFTYPTFFNKAQVVGTRYDYVHGGAPNGVETMIPSTKVGTIASIGHKRGRDGNYHSGGPLLINKRETLCGGDSNVMYRPGYAMAYKGVFYLQDGNSGAAITGAYALPNVTQETHLAQVNSYGAEAYAALKPDLPDFSPVVSLLELKDVPAELKARFKRWRFDTKKYQRAKKGTHPTLFKLKDGSLHGQNVAETYISLKFGWVPIVQDTLSFVKAFHKRKKRFDQLLRDEARSVHRTRHLHRNGTGKVDNVDSFTTRTTPYNPSIKPVYVTQCYGGGLATDSVHSGHNTRIWCAGRSKYLLPPGPRDGPWKDRLMRRILGLNLQPNTLYNIMPWSWLADYFTTLGSFYDAVSSGIADKVVFDYAYLMHEYETHVISYATQYICTSVATGSGTKHEMVTAFREQNESRKTRVAASPFGFGLSQESLTPNQLGILGALGYSRL